MSAWINFIGDIALFKMYEKLGIDPFSRIVLPVADYHIANFEFIISNNRSKRFYDIEDRYAVSYGFLNQLALNKINAFGLANNHSMDYGADGAFDVIHALQQKSSQAFGFGRDSLNPLLFECNSIKFAVIGVCKKGRWSKEHHNHLGPDDYDKDLIVDCIQSYKKNVHHVIIYPHWGTELISIPDEADVINAKLFIDQGASLVVGHHPHVIQGIESYKHGLIAYSLGSFIYIPEEETGYKSGEAFRDLSLCLSVNFNEHRIISHQPIFYQYDRTSKLPVSTNNQRAEKQLNFLSCNINNRRLYYTNIRRVLFQRELRSFLSRIKKNPLRTVSHYLKYIKFKHFKKLIRRG